MEKGLNRWNWARPIAIVPTVQTDRAEASCQLHPCPVLVPVRPHPPHRLWGDSTAPRVASCMGKPRRTSLSFPPPPAIVSPLSCFRSHRVPPIHHRPPPSKCLAKTSASTPSCYATICEPESPTTTLGHALFPTIFSLRKPAVVDCHLWYTSAQHYRKYRHIRRL
jgi:hypothetical protein